MVRGNRCSVGLEVHVLGECKVLTIEVLVACESARHGWTGEWQRSDWLTERAICTCQTLRFAHGRRGAS